MAGDLDEAESLHARAVAGLTAREQVRRVLHPAVVEVGERWFRGECEVFQEHAATEFLHRKLGLLIEEARAREPPASSLGPGRDGRGGSPRRRRADRGAAAGGRRLAGASRLGVDLPVREIQQAVEKWRPDAVCLSFVLSRNINKRFDELAAIRGAPVFVGGRSILNYQGLARGTG